MRRLHKRPPARRADAHIRRIVGRSRLALRARQVDPIPDLSSLVLYGQA